jgi:hypothetical protein
MQILANYSFTTDKTIGSESMDLYSKALAAIDKWLTGKGASAPLNEAGSFVSKTKYSPEGSYTRSNQVIGDKLLSETTLQEFAKNDQIFTTSISVLACDSSITIFTSLAAEATSSVIAPSFSDARCPSIVREIIGLSSQWKHDGNNIPVAKSLREGESSGHDIVDHIEDPKRTHPIVVVSQIDGEEIWPNISTDIAYDLTGLAHVYAIDEDATWALTEKLGKENSCYLGAVRLYWPKFSAESPISSTVWTASRLLPQNEGEDNSAREKFRNQLRGKVMSTSAVALSTPARIEAFKAEVNAQEYESLAKKSQTLEAAYERIKQLSHENSNITSQLTDARKSLTRLSASLQEAQTRIDTLTLHDAANEDTVTTPKPGEIKFYKKTHSKPGFDILERISDCGHTSWQNSSKADKAKKGLIRLEGLDNWSLVQHCGTCKGGGVWRVKW